MNSEHSKQQYVAAVDLGSNSFHLLIAREGAEGGIRVVDTVREMVRLGAGLDAYGNLSAEARQSALSCLERFRQRLQAIPPHRIRAVGTNTLRAAKNSRQFLAEAQSALGHPISVISGHEEARLVYLGAAFGLAVGEKRRLVIDIGGGSTELIIGQGYRPIKLDSLFIGCVSMTRRFFTDGAINKEGLEKAKTVVLRELEPVIQEYRECGWDEVVGTSGTIKAIGKVARGLAIKQDWISTEGLLTIAQWLEKTGDSDLLEHVSPQRRPVFVGGFIILATICEALGIEQMEVSEGALREGVAYDLIGRLHNHDSRHQGIESLLSQFQTDAEQSRRVEKLALQIFDQTRANWHLVSDIDRKLIIWSAQLHEIGIAIAYPHHHQHGAYIIANSDIDGFSRPVQRALSILVGNARQKIHLQQLEWLNDDWTQKMIRLITILRLAIAFHRGRSDITMAEMDEIMVETEEHSVTVLISQQWAKQHPLTIFDLEMERDFLGAAGMQLTISISGELAEKPTD